MFNDRNSWNKNGNAASQIRSVSLLLVTITIPTKACKISQVYPYVIKDYKCEHRPDTNIYCTELLLWSILDLL
jgi:hypothetical protein